METRFASTYAEFMKTSQTPDDFFLFPRASRTDDILLALERLERLEGGLSEPERQALADLLRGSRQLAGLAFLVPQLSPFQFFLLVGLIGLAERIGRLEGHSWVHPPFP
jgi:hypothetical protein